jgi:hypothetical protein
MGLEPATFSRATIRRHLFLGVGVRCKISLPKPIFCSQLRVVAAHCVFGGVYSGVKRDQLLPWPDPPYRTEYLVRCAELVQNLVRARFGSLLEVLSVEAGAQD